MLKRRVVVLFGLAWRCSPGRHDGMLGHGRGHAGDACLGPCRGGPDLRDTARDRHRLRGERGIGHGDTDHHRDRQGRTRHPGRN